MMKNNCFKIISITVSLFFALNINAQAQIDSANVAVLKTQLLDTVCTCISKSDLSNVKTNDQVQTLLISCLMGDVNLFVNYITAIGGNLGNQSQMQEMGTKLGIDIMQSCPAMMTIVANMSQNMDQSDSSRIKSSPPKSK